MGFNYYPAYLNFGEVEGLPDPEPGVYCLVSTLVLLASDREDLLSPGDLIRDDNGQIIGCANLQASAGDKAEELKQLAWDIARLVPAFDGNMDLWHKLNDNLPKSVK